MTDSPQNLADRPVGVEPLGLRSAGDLLSDVLATVRLRGERMVAYAPNNTFSMGFARAGALHIIEAGELRLDLDDDAWSERVCCGDVILLPRGDPHHIKSTATGEPPRWLCGTFTIGDPGASHLLATLPAAIVLRNARGQALEWLEVSRRMLLFEMSEPTQGSVVMVARILDLLFIQILRAWAHNEGAEPGWLAGAIDPDIGPALGAIHSDPGREWAVGDLAHACGLSRSAFAARFTARVGRPPATYLAVVRFDTAANLLRETALPIGDIAARVGYRSEAAFSRAFRQHYGAPPARWRRAARAG